MHDLFIGGAIVLGMFAFTFLLKVFQRKGSLITQLRNIIGELEQGEYTAEQNEIGGVLRIALASNDSRITYERTATNEAITIKLFFKGREFSGANSTWISRARQERKFVSAVNYHRLNILHGRTFWNIQGVMYWAEVHKLFSRAVTIIEQHAMKNSTEPTLVPA